MGPPGPSTSVDTIPVGSPGTPELHTTAASRHLKLPEFDAVTWVVANHIKNAATAYYVGMFERIGAFRAVDELVDRYLGGMSVGTGDLEAKIRRYLEHQPLRFGAQERNDVVLRLFEEDTLERLLVDLSDATIAWDVSQSSVQVSLAPTLPARTARLGVEAVIESLQIFLHGQGSGGVGLVAQIAGEQFVDAYNILTDSQLGGHLSGAAQEDMFAVIATLLEGEKDRPSDFEAHQMARMASTGRKALLLLAEHADGATLTKPTDAELDTLGELICQWREAHRSISSDTTLVVDDADTTSDDELQVIRLRHRVA